MTIKGFDALKNQFEALKAAKSYSTLRLFNSLVPKPGTAQYSFAGFEYFDSLRTDKLYQVSLPNDTLDRHTMANVPSDLRAQTIRQETVDGLLKIADPLTEESFVRFLLFYKKVTLCDLLFESTERSPPWCFSSTLSTFPMWWPKYLTTFKINQKWKIPFPAICKNKAIYMFVLNISALDGFNGNIFFNSDGQNMFYRGDKEPRFFVEI